MALDALGHEVYLTKNGKECIKNYTHALTFNYENRSTSYDVVANDYLMPFKDGWQKEIAKKLYLELKKWEKSDGLSIPTGPVHITDNYNVISD